MRTISIATRTLSRTERSLLVTFVMLATALVFARCLGFAFIADFDDTANLVDNDRWRGLDADHLDWMFTAYWQGHYHPLTWLTWAIDWTLWGLDARGYHLQNVLWHVLNAGLCFALFRSLLVRFGGGARDAALTNLGAAAGALFFAIHPLRAESVAWVTERRDVVSGAFFLLALLAYLRARERAPALWMIASFCCTALSLLAKAWAITLPAVLLVLDAWPLRRDLRRPAVWLEKVPFVVLCAGFAIFALRAQQDSGALQAFEELPLAHRIGTALYGIAFYPWVTLLPIDLIPMYEMTGDEKVTYTRYALGAVFVLCGAGAAIALRRRAPAVTCALVVYAILVAPVSGFAQSGPQATADRYSYVPCLPFAALYAYGVNRWFALRVLAPPHLLVLAIIATLQVGIWRDAQTLWTTTSLRDHENLRANLWLGEMEYLAYLDTLDRVPRQQQQADEQLARARDHLRRAWLRNSKHPRVLNMRGIVLFVTGKPEDVRDANRFWRRTIALWPNDPEAQQARNMLEKSKRMNPELFDEVPKKDK